MSYSGAADNQYYNGASVISVASNQALLLAGYIKPTNLGASNLGIISVSTSATDGRVSQVFCVRISTASRVQLVVDGFSFNGPSATLSTGSWQLAGFYLPTGFTGASQTYKSWLDANTATSSVTIPDYSGASFLSGSAGDGPSSITDHKGAYLALWAGVNSTQADSIMSSMLTTQPSAISPSPTVDWPFASAAPGGFSTVGAVSIDAADNPTLSGGGGGPTAALPPWLSSFGV